MVRGNIGWLGCDNIVVWVARGELESIMHYVLQAVVLGWYSTCGVHGDGCYYWYIYRSVELFFWGVPLVNVGGATEVLTLQSPLVVGVPDYPCPGSCRWNLAPMVRLRFNVQGALFPILISIEGKPWCHDNPVEEGSTKTDSDSDLQLCPRVYGSHGQDMIFSRYAYSIECFQSKNLWYSICHSEFSDHWP